MKLSLRARLIVMGVALAVVPLAVLMPVLWNQNAKITEIARTGFLESAEANLQHVAESIYTQCENTAGELTQLVVAKLALVEHEVDGRGGFHIGQEMVEWEARNQFSGETSVVELPRMMIGDEWLRQVRDPEASVAVVDVVDRDGGATATVFQRINEAGDMLRVATSVVSKAGERAIGTYIPAVNPDGSDNGVVRTVMSGESFLGRAFVVDGWQFTAYDPILDADGNVIGMLFAGVKEETAVARLHDAIVRSRVGNTGYVFVIQGQGEERGRYVVSKNGERDGEDVWGVEDDEGNFVIQEMIAKALALGPTESTDHRYTWRDPSDPEPMHRIAYLKYYEPLDWVIGASDTEEDFMAATTQASEISDRGMYIVVGLAIVAGLVAAGLGWLSATRINSQVGPIAKNMETASEHLGAASGQVSLASTQLASGASENASSAEELSSSLEEMLSTTESNAHNSREATSLADATRASAQAGSSRMAEMNESMNQVTTAADEVAQIIKTIDEIAFQTNILALNAAVEAARAGEAGKGFAVVADEVRNLAQRCATAARDTAERIELSVTSSKDAASHTQDVTAAFADIMSRVENLSRFIAEIAAATEEHQIGIGHIRQAVGQMEKVTQTAAANAEETAASAEELNAQAETLSDLSRNLHAVLDGGK